MVGTEITFPNLGVSHVVPVENSRSCGDPRHLIPYASEELPVTFRQEASLGALRSFGIVLGDAAGLMAMHPHMSHEEAIRLTALSEKVQGRNMAVHHSTVGGSEVGGLVGCGHFLNTSSGEHDNEYHVEGVRVRAAGEHLLSLGRRGALDVESDMLSGRHVNEVGIVIVDSTKYTIDSDMRDGGRLYRVDHGRHLDSLGVLATAATRYDYDTDWRDLTVTVNQQRDVTLGILAEGLPLFWIDLDKGMTEAQQVAVIGQ